MKALITYFLIFTFSLGVFAQIDTPEPSPRCIVDQRVGLTQIKIDYSRPSMKGRVVFGDLVPYGQVWRTGANAVSTIEVDKRVFIGEQILVKGRYAILTVPGRNSWEIRFYKYERNSWNYYDGHDPLFTVFSQVEKLNRTVESFTMSFNNLKSDAADLELSWENSLVAISLKFDTDKQVKGNIERFAKDPTGTLSSNYFYAARYYAEQGFELEKAYTWIQEAINLRKSEAYWMYRTKAEIEGQLGMIKEAIASYEKSNKLVAKIGNEVYIKNNNRAVEELKQKK